MKKLPVLLLGLLAAACGSPDMTSSAPTGGTVVIAMAADPTVLIPPLITQTAEQAITDHVFDRLARIGPDMNTLGDESFEPQLAESWRWAADSLSITFNLNPAARWHDGEPVTAADVVFTYSVYRDPAVFNATTQLVSIDSVTARGTHEVVFWYNTRSREQFFNTVYHMLIIPEHLLGNLQHSQLASSAFARNPVGSGRFRFAYWEPGVQIEIVADTGNYRGRPPLDRVVVLKATDGPTAIAWVMEGQADFVETLRPPNVAELARHPNAVGVPYLSLDYAYLAFNTRARRDSTRPHPLFASRAMRRAVAHALNRDVAVRNVFDTLAYVAMGPFVRAMATADTSIPQLAYDPQESARILDSLGWTLAPGREYRSKNGQELTFQVTVPGGSAGRTGTSTLFQEDLRKVGVRLRVESFENAAFAEAQETGDFDLVYGAWHMDPSPAGIRQTWMSHSPAGTGGSNHGYYSNATVDAKLDSALAGADPARLLGLYRDAYAMIVDDVAAVFVYEPRMVAGAHARLRIPRLPAHAWWAALDEWSVDPSMYIERDLVGLRTPQ